MEHNALPKLPVFATIRDVFVVSARHAGELLRFASPWLIAVAVITGALYAAYFDAERASITATGSGSNMLWVLTFAASTIIGALIAVPWHRSILLREPQSLASGVALTPAKIAYVVKATALMLVLSLPLMVALLMPSATEDTEGGSAIVPSDAIFFLLVAVFVVWMFVLNRVSLILPATAVENSAVGVAQSWASTRGNTLRLAVVSFVATFVPMLVPLGLALWLAPTATAAMDANTAPSLAAYVAANTVWELFALVAGMLYVTFLSLAYRHFFGASEGSTTTALN